MKTLQTLESLNAKIQRQAGMLPFVLGNGNINSKVMLIGEAPGKNEIEQQRPFVGAAGKHLTRFMETLQLKREEIYITNTVKIRPTQISKKTGKSINRSPNREELETFIPLLLEEIHIISPQMIVTLGNVPLRAVLQQEQVSISELHGKVQKMESTKIQVFPLYHPAYVIYNREIEPIYQKDLIYLKSRLFF